MIIFRYISREIYGAMTAVTMVLLLIFVSNQFVRFIDKAAMGKMAGGAVLQLMALAIPHMLGMLLPLGLYLGIILAFGRMSVDSEVTVLRSCGVSRKQITTMTMIASLLVVVIIAFVMLWLNPIVSAQRNRILAGEGAHSALQAYYPGRFIPQGKGKRVIYFGDMSHDHRNIDDIFVAEVSPNKDIRNDPAWGLLMADRGYERRDSKTGDDYIVAVNGNRYMGAPGSDDFTILHFEKYHVLVSEKNQYIDNEEDSKSSLRLFREFHRNRFAASELQWRIAMPLQALILCLIAIPLSGGKPRQGKYARLIPAIILYMVYANTLLICKDWINQERIPPSVGLWWVHGLAFLAAVLLFFGPKLFRYLKR